MPDQSRTCGQVCSGQHQESTCCQDWSRPTQAEDPGVCQEGWAASEFMFWLSCLRCPGSSHTAAALREGHCPAWVTLIRTVGSTSGRLTVWPAGSLQLQWGSGTFLQSLSPAASCPHPPLTDFSDVNIFRCWYWSQGGDLILKQF